MRFIELQLRAFGPFTDRRLDLSQGDHGLHVVYGPNEAGKSSALRAIHAALFGVPERTTDNFRHTHGDMRVGAVIRNGAGEDLAFVRRKGRSKTLLQLDTDLGPHLDTALDAYLDGVSGETFARVYGIDQVELRQGGEELRQLRGLSGESLFAAGLGRIAGAANLSDVLKQLDEEAGSIYSSGSGSKKTALKLALADYKETQKKKHEASLSSHKWQQQQRDLENARSELERIRQQLADLRSREHRLQRLQSALPRIAERKQLRAQLAELGDVVLLPAAYSEEARSRCQSDLRHVEQRIAALEIELDGDQGPTARCAEIKIPAGLLDHEALITSLQNQLGAHLKAASDVKELRIRRDALQTQLERLRRDLGISAEPPLAIPHIPADRRVIIENLGNNEKRLRAAPVHLATEQRKLEQTLQACQAEVEDLGPPLDVSNLERTCVQARNLGAIEDDLTARRHSLAALEAEADRQLRSLGLWTGSRAELVALPVPMVETAEASESELARAREHLTRLTEESSDQEKELAEVAAEINILSQADHVPTEAELHRLRERRDHGWTLVRNAWLEGQEDREVVAEFVRDKTLAEAYEESVARADVMADRLRREAERVAHLSDLRARQQVFEDRLAALRSRVRQADATRAELEDRWLQHWTPLGIQPLSPREMQRWLRRQAQLIDADRKIQEERQRLQHAEARYETCRGQLAQVLTDLDSPAPCDEPLSSLLVHAERILKSEADKRDRQKAADRELARCRKMANEQAEQQRHAIAELQTWQLAWEAAMQEIGCPADAPAEQATARLRSLAELTQQVDKIADLELRISAIERDAQEFEVEVRSATARLAPDLARLPVTQAASELASRLSQARTDKARRDELLVQADRQRMELEDLRGQRTERMQQLAQLCHLAGVPDSDIAALPQIEHASHVARGCQQRLADVERHLRELAGGSSIEELVADAERCDVDRLAAESVEWTAEIETLDGQRELQAIRVNQLEADCSAADGSAVAADADQQALGILSQLHANAERYLKLRLATALLRHQIEKYRAENQDPLLTRASTLFAQLTCGEFSGLRTEYTDNDQPVIVGVRKSGELATVTTMSEGTRDQLYLALRLGYLEHRLFKREPLPLVVDDILVNFDDDRAAATLRVLAALSRQTQVIFFTHHQHLVDLATAHIREELFVHELNGQQPPRVEAALGRKRRPR